MTAAMLSVHVESRSHASRDRTHSGVFFTPFPRCSLGSGRKRQLRHGQRWGNLELDAERLCLVNTACHGSEVDIECIVDSAGALDWIFQVRGKWGDAEVLSLLEALNEIFRPQATLCSFGVNKRITDVGKFLRQRIAGWWGW